MRFLKCVSEEQLRQEYSRCTLFVMPSAKEGFGLVFIEAMAHGKPVIGARAGGAAEVIEHGLTGMLVEFGNVREIVRTLDDLLSKPELMRRMGEAGRKETQARFSFEAYCARWESVCEEFQGQQQNKYSELRAAR
jgi:glycosyltransferase involved in cell wall biosynthesis